MLLIILLLLLVFFGFGIIGLVVKGLFWLFVVGLILFLATAAWGWMTQRSSHTP